MRLLGGMKDDIHNYPKRLEGELRRLQGESFAEGEKKVVQDYVKMLEARGLNKGRIAKAVFLLRDLRRQLHSDFRDADKKKLEELVRWVNDNPKWSAWTRSDAKGLLKRFYRWLRSDAYEGPYPPEVTWIKTSIKKSEIEEPEIFTAEDAEKMIKVADKMRDKALIAVDYEGGFRISELLGMKIGDVSFDEHGAKVRVLGKTGGRTVRLITSTPLLSRWIESHPTREFAEAPIWVSLDHYSGKGKRLSYGSTKKIIAATAKKAGLTKRAYPHLFRHSAATRDAHYLNEAELRIKYGWGRDSKIPATYVHLAGKDVDEKLISIYGNGKPEPIKEEFVPVVCVKCSEKNSPGTRFCGRCGTPLDQRELAKQSVEIEDLKQKVDEILRRLETRK